MSHIIQRLEEEEGENTVSFMYLLKAYSRSRNAGLFETCPGSRLATNAGTQLHQEPEHKEQFVDTSCGNMDIAKVDTKYQALQDLSLCLAVRYFTPWRLFSAFGVVFIIRIVVSWQLNDQKLTGVSITDDDDLRH